MWEVRSVFCLEGVVAGGFKAFENLALPLPRLYFGWTQMWELGRLVASGPGHTVRKSGETSLDCLGFRVLNIHSENREDIKLTGFLLPRTIDVSDSTECGHSTGVQLLRCLMRSRI